MIKRWIGLGALALCVATACVSGDDNVIPTDAGGDQTTSDSASGGYTVTLSTPSVIVEPGAAAPVTVTVARTGSFNDAINLTLNGGPTGVTGSAFVAAGQTSIVMNVQAATTAAIGTTASAMVAAASTPSNVTHTVPLFVRVGHVVLMVNTTTTWIVPADVTSATVVAWGAGGGSGAGFQNASVSGGNGGAGGFEQADFVFVPGQLINVIVGTGGAGGPEVSCGGTCMNGAGAGGGGYTALAAPMLDAGADATQLLIVAGGGGGGQGGGNIGSPYGGFAGGAGGGASGASGGAANGQGALAGGPGTSSAGGGSAVQEGTSLTGGSAGSGGAEGGVPGGGSSATGSASGGGGGGGYFGGGAGSTQPNGGGGGGGSGFVLVSATNTTSTTGDGGAPPAVTLTYYGNNAGVGGVGSTGAGNGGGPGRIVIYLH